MSIVQQLKVLLEGLAQIRDGISPSTSTDGILVEPFGDDEYIYVEAELPGAHDIDIDISIHKTRAFVRMERTQEQGRPPGVSENEHRKMIGWVGFLEGGATRSAVLHDDGHWSCAAAPHVATLLNHDRLPLGDSNDDGWSNAALIAAARRLNGFAWLSMGRPLEF